MLLPRFIRTIWCQIKQNYTQMSQNLLRLTKKDKTYKQFTPFWSHGPTVGTNGRDHMVMGLQPGEGRAWGWGPYHGGGWGAESSKRLIISIYIYICREREKQTNFIYTYIYTYIYIYGDRERGREKQRMKVRQKNEAI